MKSKPIDAGVLPKIWYQVPATGQALQTTQITVASLNFSLAKPGAFRIGHYILAHRDSSSSLQSILRQLYIDSAGVYSGNQFGASITPYGIENIAAELIKNLAAGPHTISLTAWCSTANYFVIDEGYINLQEL
jgi:hypothetical protein